MEQRGEPLGGCIQCAASKRFANAESAHGRRFLDAACHAAYTPARKGYIHNFLFSELIYPKITFQLQEIFFSGINFPQITYHIFVCDSENDMKKLFWNYFLENLISVT